MGASYKYTPESFEEFLIFLTCRLVHGPQQNSQVVQRRRDITFAEVFVSPLKPGYEETKHYESEWLRQPCEPPVFCPYT